MLSITLDTPNLSNKLLKNLVVFLKSVLDGLATAKKLDYLLQNAMKLVPSCMKKLTQTYSKISWVGQPLVEPNWLQTELTVPDVRLSRTGDFKNL